MFNKAARALDNYLFILLLIVGVYQIPLRLFGFDFINIPGDFGDTRFNNYILEHGYQFFSGKLSSYWNAHFMYPEKNVISYSDNLLGTLPFYALFRILSFDPETSLQGWIIFIFILNFLFAYRVFIKFGFEKLSASIGSYVFTFSLPVIGSINHLQVLPYFMVPWAFYGLFMYFKTFQFKSLLLCILSVVIQFYCGIYLGFLLVLGLMTMSIVFALSLIIKWKKDTSTSGKINWVQQSGYLILGLLVFMALLFPLIKPYYERSLISGMKKYDEVKDSLPVIQSYLLPYYGSRAWKFLFDLIPHPKEFWNHYLFPGGIALFSFVVAPLMFFFRKEQGTQFKLPIILWTSLLLLIILIMKFGNHDFSIYKYVRQMPGFSSMRAMNRCIFIELFFFAFLTCYVVGFLLRATRYSAWLYVVLPLLVIIDQHVKRDSLMSYNKKESQMRVEKLTAEITSRDYKKYAAFIYMPNDTSLDYSSRIDAMLVSQKLNFPTVDGYTASYPSHYYNLIFHNDMESLNEWLASNNMDTSKILIINHREYK